MFGARKAEVVEPSVRVEVPESDPLLRNEIDPDPLIEEMVGRLREGLSSLVAVDEWGRPLAWRNVVRLALGPTAGRLRDTEQALNLAVSMIPAAEAPAAEPVVEPVVEPVAEAAPVEEPAVETAPEAVSVVEPPATTEFSAEPPATTENIPPMEYLAALADTIEHPAEQPAEQPQVASEPTVEVILPASEAMPEAALQPVDEVQGHAVLKEEPIVVEEPPAAPQAAAPSYTVRAASPSAATSLFTVSGDQRAVPVSPLSPGQLLRGSGTDDSTTAKYDRFLTGLYGQGQQVGRDEDRGPR